MTTLLSCFVVCDGGNRMVAFRSWNALMFCIGGLSGILGLDWKRANVQTHLHSNEAVLCIDFYYVAIVSHLVIILLPNSKN